MHLAQTSELKFVPNTPVAKHLGYCPEHSPLVCETTELKRL